MTKIEYIQKNILFIIEMVFFWVISMNSNAHNTPNFGTDRFWFLRHENALLHRHLLYVQVDPKLRLEDQVLWVLEALCNPIRVVKVYLHLQIKEYHQYLFVS
ncbi:hypothetical protein BBD39_08180 [Arsenophonus endosymbiont of Bemisia tabaci Asia II 3]|nr:hypothetical protein BBD39_08180 [Arsenophonus endosymbiont of Bemisia tabaci Asia II 3]